jgi:hypothetical protein
MKFKQNRNLGPGRGLVRTIIPSALVLLFAMPIAAAQSADLDDRFSVSLGVFIADRDTLTRLDGSVPDSGTEVDLEGTLGFKKSDSVFRIDGYYRFNEKHRIDFSAFDLSRKASKQIDEEFIWDGETYPVDVLVNAALDLKVYKLAYTWSFMRREDWYLGASLGLYVADIGTSISAESGGQFSSRGITAPLPVLGLRGQYEFSERWTLRGSAEVFAFDYGDYSGDLYDLYAGVDYQFSAHVAVGLGINSVRMDIGVGKPNFNGNLDWQYDGGLLFFKFDF